MAYEKSETLLLFDAVTESICNNITFVAHVKCKPKQTIAQPKVGFYDPHQKYFMKINEERINSINNMVLLNIECVANSLTTTELSNNKELSSMNSTLCCWMLQFRCESKIKIFCPFVWLNVLQVLSLRPISDCNTLVQVIKP